MVVGIGASAGGLDACRRLLTTLPPGNGMAFILVQHLDPTHESMLVDLLAGHTPMRVQQAENGMKLEQDHLYVIPPGAYLSVANGALQLSQPQERHGARLPFDFLLRSLAQECGARTICVVLSGTGADGSIGLKAVKQAGGHVIVQNPEDAAYDGMPRSAIMTGAVDRVLPVTEIPGALAAYRRKSSAAPGQGGSAQRPEAPAGLAAILDLLRSRTAHDFTLYKSGTLQRRIERRMSMTETRTADMAQYLDLLRSNPGELDLLAKDLLINVTSFFRDPKVFDFLAEKIVPDLVSGHLPDRPIRIWVAGCSTGEEAYSLAMLLLEQMARAGCNLKLQIFASDVDPDAITGAREGVYPETIAADVSQERLARFFTKEANGYRVLPELRSAVVFTVQDLLIDPPFSRIDLISCRNLLIYLGPEAQAKVVSLFHFALREGGVLLLGTSETVVNPDGRFEVIHKPARLYRRIGRNRPGQFGLPRNTEGGVRPFVASPPAAMMSRQAALAGLCKQLVLETYAPAAVLVNGKHECLYFLGPTDRYLRVAPGYPTHDLLAMVDEELRIKLRSALQRASHANAQLAVVRAGRTSDSGGAAPFRIELKPVVSEGEELLLICFVDEPKPERKRTPASSTPDTPQVGELERELKATRMELQGAIRNLEIAGEEQKAVNEEALSANEEYQSTNEELLTSKEELQSLNEELTALNGQLQETLERQRTTSNDLQNVLYSTDVPTIFLDANLNIRFFTPTTKSLFRVIPSDVGRPLEDLHSLAPDSDLLGDAQAVLRTVVPVEREIETGQGTWYIRRILPYRTQDDAIEGVVITFVEITERKRAANELERAKRQAEAANAAKTRFLAAASHDLRQPLQTLTLLQGLLARTVQGEQAQRLIARFHETLGAIEGMLNTLLDINQIDAGVIHADFVTFPINDLLVQVKDELTYHAEAKGLTLRVVACGLSVHSDPGLLEQMIRNLVSNALKYTQHGKVLLGCRRHRGMLSIEVWDTGIGIPDKDLKAIFEEYHQLDNAARERSRGLGLGLSIVQRLGTLLGHRVRVSSQPGKGSVFAIEVALPTHPAEPQSVHRLPDTDTKPVAGSQRTGRILVVEDDPDLRDLLGTFLRQEGHQPTTASNGPAALALVADGTVCPDIILADYNLPNGMNGLQLAEKLQERLGRKLPTVVLTGDTSAATLQHIAAGDSVRLSKPVKLRELTAVIQRLLPVAQSTAEHRGPPQDIEDHRVRPPVIYVVDDDSHIRESLRGMIEDFGMDVEDFGVCEAFLEAYRPGREACLVIDAYLPGMNGLELLRRLGDAGHKLPAIMITGNSDVAIAVEAMKAGALDFIEKPIHRGELLGAIERALEQSRDSSKANAWRQDAAAHLARLTARQQQILDLVLAGHPSKNIAADLGISQRTVENHRAAIMEKTACKSIPALARLVVAASGSSGD